ncbi:MAG: glycine--tRNA ligase [Candidatus Gracilibacteria bacterium]|nr:glycine--tRNA ligase [Candidatus Gracilibacteria bacterium]
MDKMSELVSLCKRRGFIYPGSEIYGGLANTWDYGPNGAQLKKNIKDFWWKTFVENRADMLGLDTAILMHPRTWEASGHVGNFTDPLIDCKSCKERLRADKLLEDKLGVEKVAGKELKELSAMLKTEKIKCPKCGNSDFTEARQFNLMFKTQQGVIEGEGDDIYLRPETAQGIFVNFKNILDTMRVKLPFGIAQIGKSFRNEITPGNFTYRTREFEQMEIEYFVKPGEEKKHFKEWKQAAMDFFLALGVKKENLRFRDHEAKELSHYSNATTDIEYQFPFGWGELMGIASRTDFDLKQHEEFSGKELKMLDPETNEKFVPYVVEPSFGMDRTVLITLLDAYCEEEVEGEKRTVLKLNPHLAPVKIAILPLVKKDELQKVAKEIEAFLRNKYTISYDETGSIGKRYRRQDEIGTPYCVTVDFDTIEKDQAVTVRDRDTMKQERIKIEDLEAFINKKLVS